MKLLNNLGLLKLNAVNNKNHYLSFLDQKEYAFCNLTATVAASDAPGLKGLALRQLASRVLGVASCIFSIILVAPKVLGGIWELGRGIAYGVILRSWTYGLLNKDFSAKYLHALMFSCLGVIRLPLTILSPRKVFTKPFIEEITTYKKKVEIREDVVIDCRAVAAHHLETMTPDELDKNWKLNELFGSIWFINLERSVDRRNGLIKRLEEIGIQPKDCQRHVGCDGKARIPKAVYERMISNYLHIPTNTPEGREKLDNQHKGEVGCYMSHLTLIRHVADKYNSALAELEKIEKDPKSSADDKEKAKNEVKKYSSVLILEDDAYFGMLDKSKAYPGGWGYKYVSEELSQKGSGTVLRKAIKDLPKDWDMLYLMTLDYDPPIATESEHLRKISRSVLLPGYAVRASMYPALLSHLNKIEGIDSVRPVDDEIAVLHSGHDCYVVHPPVVAQTEDESVIHSIEENKQKKKKYRQYFAPPVAVGYI